MKGDRAIVIAGGGTGGHVYPGLALASELRRRRPERPLVWIGARGGLEERIVPREEIPLVLLPLAGVAGRGVLRGVTALWLAAAATARLLVRFARRRPAIAVGVGGFASGPAILAALLLGVPTLLLEQNSIPGRTNRVLAPFAGAIAVSFEESAAHVRGRVEYTGNPVRAEIVAIEPRAHDRLATLLSFGGSRGARAINEAWIAALPSLADLDIDIVLQTGDADEVRVRDAAEASGARTEVHAFLHDMPRRLAEADLVVGRSGATTVAELTAAGRPSILVPFPAAADDHQRANARALESRGAAVVIDPDDLDPQALVSAVRALANAPDRLARMADAARALGRPDAAARVADLVESLLGGAR